MSISSQPIPPRNTAQLQAPTARPQAAPAEQTPAESGATQAADGYVTAEGLDEYDVLHTELEGLDPGAIEATDDEATLHKLYNFYLKRDADPTGLEHWGKLAAELRASGKSETEINEALIDKIVNSPEYLEKNPPAATTPAGDSTEPVNGAMPVSGAPTAATTGSAPYINQVSPNGADGNYANGESNCGPTSMAMIARAYGYGEGKTDAQLIMELGEMGGTTGAGTGVNGIAAMAAGIGQGSETRGPGANVEWIREQLEAGKMVVANGDYYAMGDHNRAKVGQGGHYVAVVGVDEAGNFLVNDPYDSAISPRAFSADELAYFISSNSNGGYQVAVG